MNKDTGNIILIGFMGSGKTTFGKWIAGNYDKAFLDTDEYIEQMQNTTIKEIFAQNGEEYFRDLETTAVRELCENTNNTVISVGGGLPIREENRKLLKQLGVVVYLNTSVDELVKRLSGDEQRPLLAGGGLREKIEMLMQQREELYESAADLIITTDMTMFNDLYSQIQHFCEENGI